MAKRGGFPGGMPGNMNNLMKQAQKMQKQMEENQKALEEKEFTATAGGGAVEVTISGKKEVTKVKISEDAVDPDDVEMLEDLIMAATNEALRKVEDEAAKAMEFDLVITGRQAIDGDTAQGGPQIAEHLGLPQVTYLEGIKYEGGNRLVVKKWTEEGYQLLEVETPCVVTVLSSANRPRYMSVRGIVEAYDKQVEVWGFDNISVEESKLGLAGSPTRVFKSFTKGAKSAGKVFELEPAEAADLIVEKLQEKFII